jgi:hypothetical protein
VCEDMQSGHMCIHKAVCLRGRGCMLYRVYSEGLVCISESACSIRAVMRVLVWDLSQT